MSKIIVILKFIFHFSVIFLVILSLFSGSLIGLLLYGDIGKQPDLIPNPFGTAINHFIYYFYLSLLGFSIYLKDRIFKKVVYALFFLSILLELLHFIIPNRSFQLTDLISNILGVTVAYFIIKIYLFFKSNEKI
tara:strand:+ start:374 stop:775 length:402 start_codon:yes stop_codon:yes gene_type:complete